MQEVRRERRDPLVSIVIPVYNKASVISQTLDSALAQSYRNLELVLINDGSTDGSLKILEEYARKYPLKVRLMDSMNKGVSAASNLGFQTSSGEYIQFLDADDLLSVDKIEEQMKILSEKDTQVITSCEWVNFREDIRQATTVPYGVFQDFDSGLDLLLRFWDHQEMMAISSYLTPRELIEKAGPWDESLKINQDGEFFTRVLLHADQVLYETKGKVYYRTPGETNVSQQKGYKAMSSLLESYQAYERAVLPVEDSSRVRIALKKVYQKFIYDVFPLYPDLIDKAEKLIQNLGVNELTYIGGPKFQQLSRIIGFKNALRLKRFLG
ncbi:glycosyltransferase family A protein [Algoriphagus sp. NG3]|uniref:glycosyltransferase family 2 protein n=1 Tax=Algoriphagus sp. NG3 TaxID=3097546 RepID=UPI002A8307DC|nr:glycosyltransferase family A protein [Algoriphagus sp. NG3]WPR77399.1 glycosyltransferase family A protein [Algoriphagus sp. NG3]